METYNNISMVFNQVKHEKILLHQLPVGKSARVKELLSKGLSRRRLLDLGLIPNSLVSVERISPSGNPIAFNIRGAIIALRKEEAQNIVVKPI
ncbi:ferrous iron transport protein A [Proteiniborus ethanoligenes]|uniref:Ferrous iron transport protein A n=1 Tax=Proteiniborus ethanoligenes TaxID=415015 RepID=A0A1H3SM91_9FIRM|nr:FeoA family protein [Proteiniborus ethanoligenes]SDZ38239.1 ferrous iron transport protein A [Proteiniborus ethanoligenes]